ncbi:matrixin family metalloprotease [Actinotalea sp. K2]|uniref:matrixin family metalloprotease n=1 Tax=Actinotalea sp. K2 TaxID=2939438 RepID=UPI00201830C0|nr:matrixin family metalloprotease [Actinotalea sp. K2]MCL3860145.1 matrixin family metalloprotease [Actinotalea sp. K2]
MDRRGRRDGRTARESWRTRRMLRQMDRAAHRAARRAGSARFSTPRVGTPRVLALLLVLVLGGALAAGWRDGGWDSLTSPFVPRVYVEIEGRAVAVPRPEPSEGRLRPVVPVTTSGSYAFLHTDDTGEPVGYDPCRPIRYVVRPDGMPPSGQALLADAVTVVSEASGLEFVDVGVTDEAPTLDRALIQPERYGPGWAPVLVAWSDESEVAELAGNVAGVAGSAAVPGSRGEGTWLAAGRMVLDAPDLVALLGRADGYEQARAIVVHELAHVVGLDHVQDTGELMHPMTSHRADLGPGDLAGLAMLGQVACQG